MFIPYLLLKVQKKTENENISDEAKQQQQTTTKILATNIHVGRCASHGERSVLFVMTICDGIGCIADNCLKQY